MTNFATNDVFSFPQPDAAGAIKKVQPLRKKNFGSTVRRLLAYAEADVDELFDVPQYEFVALCKVIADMPWSTSNEDVEPLPDIWDNELANYLAITTAAVLQRQHADDPTFNKNDTDGYCIDNARRAVAERSSRR